VAHTAAVALNTSVASAATVDTSAWYVLVNRYSGKAVEITGRSADGAAVGQYVTGTGPTATRPHRVGRHDKRAHPPDQGNAPPLTRSRAPSRPIRERQGSGFPYYAYRLVH
jgi:hypothetical protein